MAKAKAKTTVAALQQRVREAEAAASRAERYLGEAQGEASAYKEQRDKAREELNDLRDKLHWLECQNSLLHGYINRVEIEDDRRWYDHHGARRANDEELKLFVPPLRMRSRGQVYTGEATPDTYTSRFGRSGRHGG